MGDPAPDVTNNADEEELGQSRPEEREKMAAEFNAQRARMKDLFLQKEEEMRKVLSEKLQLESEILGLREELQQLRTLSHNQKSEIESFQLLLHETVEASSSACEGEVRKLRLRNLELEQQLNMLSRQQASQAQEDAESLRSLVEPLKEEIHALKDKLRSTDAQLQAQLQSQPPSDPSAPAAPAVACDMCLNYEQQLVAEQKQTEAAKNKVKDLERALKMATEELESSRSIHEETVRSWRSDRSSTSSQIEELRSTVEACRRIVEEKTKAAEDATKQAIESVTALTVHRETLQHGIDSLRRDNEMLLGKYTQKAEEMQNEDINLPNTVEALQEHLLRVREELIYSAVGRESAAAELDNCRAELHNQVASNASLIRENHRLSEELQQLSESRSQLNELGEQLRRSGDKIEELLEDKKRLQTEVLELRSQTSSLQSQLDASERVQQDFVRLSQSLQVRLERIRESESEVRWQFEEDVSECPDCRTPLPDNKHKFHCRHCGRVFCGLCVRREVCGGPRRRSARVCQVCYTLLQPDAKPYFATQPPQLL